MERKDECEYNKEKETNRGGGEDNVPRKKGHHPVAAGRGNSFRVKWFKKKKYEEGEKPGSRTRQWDAAEEAPKPLGKEAERES